MTVNHSSQVDWWKYILSETQREVNGTLKRYHERYNAKGQTTDPLTQVKWGSENVKTDLQPWLQETARDFYFALSDRPKGVDPQHLKANWFTNEGNTDRLAFSAFVQHDNVGGTVSLGMNLNTRNSEEGEEIEKHSSFKILDVASLPTEAVKDDTVQGPDDRERDASRQNDSLAMVPFDARKGASN